jgi:hypothetical protein
MPFYSIEQKIVGLGKETTRGIAVPPSKYIPATADSFIDYKLNLIEDELVRGGFEKYPPFAGTKEASGTINIDVDSSNIGDFLLSLLGNVETEDVGESGNVYQHTFTRSNSITLPSYTIYFDLALITKQYPLSVVKSIAFTGAGDNRLTASISVLSKTEETTTETMSPTWSIPAPFMFYQTQIKVDGNAVSYVKDWNLTIDNGATGLRTLTGTQDITDIVANAKLSVSGGFTVYFDSLTERDKFLLNNPANIEIIMTGAEIETGYNHQLKIQLPRTHYTAYPFSNVDGLLGAAVTFNAYYGTTNSITIILINTTSSY